MSSIASRIGERLGFSTEQVARLRQMALLHDIGKLAVPNRILDKRGPLTDQEFAIVREHPRHTVEILSRVPIFSELADEAGSHHERMDGSGYHRGIPAGTLSAAARVLTVADVTEALGSDRPYRKGMPPDAVAQVLLRQRRHGALSACRRSRARRAQRATPRPPSTRSLFSLARS